MQMDASWLKRRRTVAEAGALHPPLGDELLAQMRSGDELWEYDSPREDWDRMMGSSGLRLVRGEVVVATQVCRMN
jgi:hypothetical protein